MLTSKSDRVLALAVVKVQTRDAPGRRARRYAPWLTLWHRSNFARPTGDF